MLSRFTPQTSSPPTSAYVSPPASTRYFSPPPTQTRTPTTPTPRPLPEWDLERAVTKNCPDRVAQVLWKDSAAVHVPVLDDFGLGLPLVKAARSGSQRVMERKQRDVAFDTGLDLWSWKPLPDRLVVGVEERHRLLAACCLLRAGAEPGRRNARGRTPEDLARAAGRPQLAELLNRAEGLRCRKLLQSIWAKRDRPHAAARVPNKLLDLLTIPKACVSDFLALA
ncbi:unnamed protein product [Polarella glacialis]|uniref:Uncharacterized protein n=1 Tax=Polarella glacialis TaxID=89957 RepID=A0A813K8Y5_POLGL|nr:unnamed protein product [Polarella glacialis]